MTAAQVVQLSSNRQRPGLRLLASASLLFAAALVQAQQPIPPLGERVTDLTATLTTAERQALEKRLTEFEARKGSQIAVLIVPTTAPEAIEAYALRVAEAWQIGRGEIDDGIVLLIAKDDRKLRIEVGYGLEGAVPDAFAKRIISERIVPRLYEGDFAGGVNDGVDALIGLIDGEPLPAPGTPQDERHVEGWGAVPFVLMFAAFTAPLFRRLLGSLFGAAAVGGASGLIVWLISSVLLASVVVGGVAFVFALAGIAGGPGRWSSGGGPWGGGSRRGGFGGGGGFRGGGGRFGGGGASGGW